jgi:hypothetical protein
VPGVAADAMVGVPGSRSLPFPLSGEGATAGVVGRWLVCASCSWETKGRTNLSYAVRRWNLEIRSCVLSRSEGGGGEASGKRERWRAS